MEPRNEHTPAVVSSKIGWEWNVAMAAGTIPAEPGPSRPPMAMGMEEVGDSVGAGEPGEEVAGAGIERLVKPGGSVPPGRRPAPHKWRVRQAPEECVRNPDPSPLAYRSLEPPKSWHQWTGTGDSPDQEQEPDFGRPQAHDGASSAKRKRLAARPGAAQEWFARGRTICSNGRGERSQADTIRVKVCGPSASSAELAG